MGQCPHCDVPLTTWQHYGREVFGCEGCGGIWISAATLSDLAQKETTTLADLDLAFRDTGGAAPLDRPTPVCADCGTELAPRAFPIAPNLPLLACEQCRMLFVQEGQLRALQEVLKPGTVAPVQHYGPSPNLPPPGIVSGDDVEVEEDEGPAEPQRGWTERLEGQPFLSWWVCGMPLWFAAVLVIPSGIFFTITELLSEQDLAWLGLPATYLMWALQGLLTTVALRITWWLLGDGAPLTFGETFVLLLRVVAVAMVLTSALGTLFMLFHGSSLVMALVSFVLRLVIFRVVMEMEWIEILVLAFVSGSVGGGIGL